MKSFATCIFFALLLTGCASVPSHQQRVASATAMADAKGWKSETLDTQPFQLTIWRPKKITPNDVLTIYVEGDGLAWLSSTIPSDDPTPSNPVALQLALTHLSGVAAYIARPCQYQGIADTPCQQQYWTGKRFAPEVIEATNAAVDVLKSRFGAKKLILVGYSGGAAVTALVAQRRNDIAAWITVAGNIDHRAWTRHHHMTPLSGSLDPLENAAKLKSLPQWHFIGGRDETVPAEPTWRFAQSMQNARVIVVDDYDHGCCWSDHFKKFQLPSLNSSGRSVNQCNFQTSSSDCGNF